MAKVVFGRCVCGRGDAPQCSRRGGESPAAVAAVPRRSWTVFSSPRAGVAAFPCWAARRARGQTSESSRAQWPWSSARYWGGWGQRGESPVLLRNNSLVVEDQLAGGWGSAPWWL